MCRSLAALWHRHPADDFCSSADRGALDLLQGAFPSFILACSILVALTGLTTVQAQEPASYSSEGFEAPRFHAGSVEGQEGWTIPANKPEVDASAAVIQTATVHAGSQALQLRNTGKRALARLPIGSGSEFYLDFQFYMPAQEEFVINPEFFFRGRKTSGEFGDFLQAQFSKTGRMPGITGSAPYKFLPGNWNRVTFHIDPAAATWSMFVNGEEVIANQPSKDGVPFSNIEYVDFSWTGNAELRDGGVFLDDVAVSADKPAF